MKTYTALLLTYHKPHVPLDTIAQDYLTHLSDREIKRRAKVQNLPFPVFREGSQKAPYMVNLKAVAKWLDSLEDSATQLHQRMAG
jgi:hypothetical protein